jgi:hypothetical protein
VWPVRFSRADFSPSSRTAPHTSAVVRRNLEFRFPAPQEPQPCMLPVRHRGRIGGLAPAAFFKCRFPTPQEPQPSTTSEQGTGVSEAISPKPLPSPSARTAADEFSKAGFQPHQARSPAYNAAATMTRLSVRPGTPTTVAGATSRKCLFAARPPWVRHSLTYIAPTPP